MAESVPVDDHFDVLLGLNDKHIGLEGSVMQINQKLPSVISGNLHSPKDNENEMTFVLEGPLDD